MKKLKEEVSLLMAKDAPLNDITSKIQRFCIENSIYVKRGASPQLSP